MMIVPSLVTTSDGPGAGASGGVGAGLRAGGLLAAAAAAAAGFARALPPPPGLPSAPLALPGERALGGEGPLVMCTPGVEVGEIA